MMPTTPNRGYAYPATTDVATIPAHLGTPLRQIDADMQTVVDRTDAIEATVDGLDARVEEAIAAQSAVRRLTLKATTAIDTAGWDKDQVIALVLTQDAAGGHEAVYQGAPVDVDITPGAATITAWVWDGAQWVWRSSATVAAPAPTAPPEWAAGTTVTTGTPTDSTVVFTFSQPIPAGVVQYRAGAGDTWRTIAKASATTVQVTGLEASTAYPAFDFQVINAAGASAALTAQAFTTPAPPPGWKVIRRATFTTATEIPLASYTPEVGPKLVQSGDPATVTVAGGQTVVYYSGTNFARPTGLWSGLENGDKKLRITCDYIGAVGGNQEQRFVIRTNIPYAFFGLSFSAASVVPDIPGATSVETTGKTSLPPASGRAVLTADGDTITFSVDGTVYRSWTLTWGSNVTRYSGAEIGVGGGDVFQGSPDAPSSMAVSELVVEAWK